jgi:hypothetical protein
MSESCEFSGRLIGLLTDSLYMICEDFTARNSDRIKIKPRFSNGHKNFENLYNGRCFVIIVMCN